MPQLEFRCVSCRQSFFVPSEVIPAEGGKGRCTACRTPLIIFPDGRILAAPGPAAHPARPSQGPHESSGPGYGALWEVRSQSPSGGISSPGPFSLADLKEKVDSNLLFEGDLARVSGGEFQPVRCYPALMQFFQERARRERADHGDEEHCVVHEGDPSRWWCPRCKDFLCERCVVNRPVIAGGAAHYICMNCEMEVDPLRKASTRSLLPGFLKRR